MWRDHRGGGEEGYLHRLWEARRVSTGLDARVKHSRSYASRCKTPASAYSSLAHTDNDASESNKRFKRVGSLILLVAAFAMLLFLIPEGMFQQWRAGAENPRPRDCDWTSIPVGDKHCHYESRVNHVSDNQGEHTVVNWYRVND